MHKFRATIDLTDEEYLALMAMRDEANGDGFWNKYTWKSYAETVAAVTFKNRLREFREARERAAHANQV